MQKTLANYCLVVVCALASPTSAAEQAKRVQPPAVWSQDVLDAFFDDAREQLVGARPTATEVAQQQVAAQPAAKASSVDTDFQWSKLVDADTLTAEIKRINNQLSLVLKKSAAFNGGGNLACRRDFGLLAVLFDVVAKFDQDVRWQRSAPAIRDRCLKTSSNCKVASAQIYADAKETHALLSELLRGQSQAGGEADSDEPRLADRTLLMQAMELAMKERLAPALSNTREFRKRSQQTAEQAQLLAVLAEVIQRDGYDYSDDDDFLSEARALREASSELSQAAKDKNYEAARAAAGRVGQSCSRCHEGYRG